MRLHRKWLLTTLLALALIGPAFGQLLPGRMPMLENGVGTPVLLMNKGVQKEIQMNDSQREKLSRIVGEVRAKYQPDMQKARLGRDMKQFFKLSRDSAKESGDKVNKALPDILNKRQLKRLHQIELQVNVLPSLNKPEVQQELKLTDKQKSDVKEISDGFKQDVVEAVKSAMSGAQQQPPLAKLRKAAETGQAIKRMADAANKKALSIFNSEQKKTWKEMTGKKIDLQLDVTNLLGARP